MVDENGNSARVHTVKATPAKFSGHYNVENHIVPQTVNDKHRAIIGTLIRAALEHGSNVVRFSTSQTDEAAKRLALYKVRNVEVKSFEYGTSLFFETQRTDCEEYSPRWSVTRKFWHLQISQRGAVSTRNRKGDSVAIVHPFQVSKASK